MNENEMRDVFREMRDEPVPADSLARVRAGVEQRIGKRSWIAGWKIAAALVVTGCLIAGFWLVRPVKIVPQPKTAQIAQVVPPPAVPLESPARPVSRPRRTRPRPVEAVPVSIRIETADPDVVILLVN